MSHIPRFRASPKLLNTQPQLLIEHLKFASVVDMKSLNYVRSCCDIIVCSKICVKFLCSLIFVYLLVFFIEGG